MDDLETIYHTSSAANRTNDASEMVLDEKTFPVFVMCKNRTQVLICTLLEDHERLMTDIKRIFRRTKDIQWLKVRWFQAHGSTKITEDNMYAVMRMLQANVGSGCLEMDSAA